MTRKEVTLEQAVKCLDQNMRFAGEKTVCRNCLRRAGTGLRGAGGAAIITYNVNLTFDPNASPTSSLGAAGPGTVTGTLTIDTSGSRST